MEISSSTHVSAMGLFAGLYPEQVNDMIALRILGSPVKSRN